MTGLQSPGFKAVPHCIPTAFPLRHHLLAHSKSPGVALLRTSAGASANPGQREGTHTPAPGAQ